MLAALTPGGARDVAFIEGENFRKIGGSGAFITPFKWAARVIPGQSMEHQTMPFVQRIGRLTGPRQSDIDVPIAVNT